MCNELAKTETKTTGNEIYNTLALKDSLESKVKAANALNSSLSLSEFEGVVIKMTDCILMPGVRKSRNANVPDASCTNTYIIDIDGKSYFSQSNGVARSIKSFVGIFNGEFDLGDGYLPVCLVSEKLTNGNTLKSLVIKE